MATTNLGLAIINSSDYVSPSPINSNMEKLDALGIDYVVEQGTSGDWWYRKWKSGRAECGVDKKDFGILTFHAGTASGHESFYYTDKQLTFGAYPFTFASTPFAQVCYEGDLNTAVGSDGKTPPIVMMNAKSSADTSAMTTSPQFWLMEFVNYTDFQPSFGIYVCGKYATTS